MFVIQTLEHSMDFSKPIFLLFITFHRSIHAQNCLLTLQFGPDLEVHLFGDGQVHKGAQDGEIGFLHTLFYCQTGFFVPRIHVDAVVRHMNEILGLLSLTDFSFSQP